MACGAARACRRCDGVGVIRYNLHSTRRRKRCQAASVRGLSNEALELHLGAAWGAWCRRGARRTSTLSDGHPERCPTCGQVLVSTGVIPRRGAPPPVRAGERAA